MEARPVETVAESPSEIWRRIEGAFKELGGGIVEGEVQRCTRAGSGHVYIDLTDGEARISCVIWADAAAKIIELPREGQLIQARYRRVRAYAKGMLGTKMSTYQTAGVALPVDTVLVTQATDIAKELYLSVLVDRGTRSVTFIASSDGGVDIETTAKENPDAIKVLNVNFVQGLQPYQCRELGFDLGLNAKQVGQLSKIMMGLYKLFNEKDLALVELNPLAILTNGDLAVLDGKINSDDNATFRHADLAAMRDVRQEDETELLASKYDLNYVTMDGNIGCMVNGAGLAMATMDVIALNGGSPANFLDVGGGATKERVTEAFKLILSSDKVKAIFVNIFGGIVRCDMIAEGIIAAVKEVDVKVPVIVRLEGTNVDKGKEILRNSGLAIQAANDINDGAKLAVAAAA